MRVSSFQKTGGSSRKNSLSGEEDDHCGEGESPATFVGSEDEDDVAPFDDIVMQDGHRKQKSYIYESVKGVVASAKAEHRVAQELATHRSPGTRTRQGENARAREGAGMIDALARHERDSKTVPQ